MGVIKNVCSEDWDYSLPSDLNSPSERLVYWLDKHGVPSLPQGRVSEVSERLGCSKTMVRKYLKDDVLPRPSEKLSVSEALFNIPLSWWEYGESFSVTPDFIPDDKMLSLEHTVAIVKLEERQKLNLSIKSVDLITELSVEYSLLNHVRAPILDYIEKLIVLTQIDNR